MKDYRLNLREKPIRDVVYNHLKNAICRGDMADGEKIPEDDLAKKFHISRTPIREALRKLEVEGLIKYYPRKGVLVKEISPQEYMEIYQIRLTLEQVAVPYIVANITDDELNRLREIYDRAQLYLERGELAEIFECEDLFNQVIVDACRSCRIGPLLESQYLYLHRLRKMTHQFHNRRQEAWIQHHNIILALEKKDVNMVCKAFANHTVASMKSFEKSQNGLRLNQFFSLFEGVE